jgi:hypothetical protein
MNANPAATEPEPVLPFPSFPNYIRAFTPRSRDRIAGELKAACGVRISAELGALGRQFPAEVRRQVSSRRNKPARAGARVRSGSFFGTYISN